MVSVTQSVGVAAPQPSSTFVMRRLHGSAQLCKSRLCGIRAAAPDELAELSGHGAIACGTLIAGGGPAGYAAAMMLAQQGHRDITILERLSMFDVYDRAKSYAFGLDFRSKSLLDSLGLGSIQEDDPLAPKRVIYLNLDGSTFEKDFFGAPAKEDMRLEHLRKFVGTTWIARGSLVKLLYRRVTEEFSDTITVRLGCRIQRVALPSEEEGQSGRVRVFVDANGASQEWNPKLLIAADGMRSAVRAALVESSPAEERVQTVKVPCESAGLHFKILGLPPHPMLRRGSDQEFVNDKAVVLPGKDIGRGPPLRMGLLPNFDLEGNRNANFILPPRHWLWDVKDADTLYDVLERSFPQMDVRRVVDRAEAERFAASDPGKFPEPQYCTALAKSYPQCASPAVDARDPLHSTQGLCVVLLGDAAHCFPPDLGQGVNSAMQDVAELRSCLEHFKDDYHRALREYEQTRLPNIKALIELMQFGAPYQYRQADKKLQTGVWALNILLRSVLNKLLPTVFDKHVFLNLHSSPNYTDILEGYRATTRRIYVLLGAVVGLCLALLTKAL